MVIKEIHEYDSQIKKIYEKENLICISDEEFNHFEYNLGAPPDSKANNTEFNDLLNHFDLVKCSEDLKYFTGLLFLYKAFINNPLEEVIFVNGRTISTYYQNLYDRRYLTFVSCCFEKCYNYWDRIGDKLWSFYPELLAERTVDFVRIIDCLEKKNLKNENLNWLINFKKNQYQDINKARKQIVHYSQYEATYRYQHMTFSENLQKINELWIEKESFPSFFKDNLKYCVEGCFHTYKYLNSIVDK